MKSIFHMGDRFLPYSLVEGTYVTRLIFLPQRVIGHHCWKCWSNGVPLWLTAPSDNFNLGGPEHCAARSWQHRYVK